MDVGKSCGGVCVCVCEGGGGYDLHGVVEEGRRVEQQHSEGVHDARAELQQPARGQPRVLSALGVGLRMGRDGVLQQRDRPRSAAKGWAKPWPWPWASPQP